MSLNKINICHKSLCDRLTSDDYFLLLYILCFIIFWCWFSFLYFYILTCHTCHTCHILSIMLYITITRHYTNYFLWQVVWQARGLQSPYMVEWSELFCLILLCCSGRRSCCIGSCVVSFRTVWSTRTGWSTPTAFFFFGDLLRN